MKNPLLISFSLFAIVSTPLDVAGQSTPKDPWEVIDGGLHHKTPDRRVQAISALGLMPGDKKARDAAENGLKDMDPRVVRAAVAALGDMNSMESLPKIKALIDSPDGKTVLAVAAVLKKFKDPEGYDVYYQILTGKRKGGGSIFDGLKDRKGLEKMGVEAVVGVLPFGGVGAGAYDYLMASEASHSSVNVAAAEALTDDKDPLAKQALIDASLDSKEPVQLASIRALAKRGDPSVVDNLKPSMYSAKPVVSYTAAAAVLHLESLRSRKP